MRGCQSVDLNAVQACARVRGSASIGFAQASGIPYGCKLAHVLEVAPSELYECEDSDFDNNGLTR